jgi:hypothetical protein
MALHNKLMPLAEVSKLVAAQHTLILAADNATLAKIEKGNWIGGTIPYFMDVDGGTKNKDMVFVTDLTDVVAQAEFKTYSTQELQNLLDDRPENGFTYLLMPAFSDIHAQYALQVPNMPDAFDKPITGWVAGKDLDNAAQVPQVVFGPTGEMSNAFAVVLHATLSDDKYAELEIVNPFVQGDGDNITFSENTFATADCFIEGVPTKFADYIRQNNIDTRLPLVADYDGAMINSSVRGIDKDTNIVSLYAPVSAEQTYRFARPLNDYVSDFNAILPQNTSKVVSTCNCILNYLYCELDGKQTKNMTGAFTFGEIAYVLVNQTMVLLSVKDK